MIRNRKSSPISCLAILSLNGKNISFPHPDTCLNINYDTNPDHVADPLSYAFTLVDSLPNIKNNCLVYPIDRKNILIGVHGFIINDLYDNSDYVSRLRSI